MRHLFLGLGILMSVLIGLGATMLISARGPEAGAYIGLVLHLNSAIIAALFGALWEGARK